MKKNSINASSISAQELQSTLQYIELLKSSLEARDIIIKTNQLQIENLLKLVQYYQGQAKSPVQDDQPTDDQVAAPEYTVLETFRKPLRLVCHDPGTEDESTGLAFLDYYDAIERVIYEGEDCYLVKMPSGNLRPKKVSRFTVCKNQNKRAAIYRRSK